MILFLLAYLPALMRRQHSFTARWSCAACTSTPESTGCTSPRQKWKEVCCCLCDTVWAATVRGRWPRPSHRSGRASAAALPFCRVSALHRWQAGSDQSDGLQHGACLRCRQLRHRLDQHQPYQRFSLTSSVWAYCTVSCLQCFETSGWVPGRASWP